MNEHETHAAVIAAMREDADDDNYTPDGLLGQSLNCFANRAEAAHKREVEKLNSAIQATVNCSDAEIDRLRREVAELRKQIGDAAAMREALQCLRGVLSEHHPYFIHEIFMIDRALAEPPRQCDVGTAKE